MTDNHDLEKLRERIRKLESTRAELEKTRQRLAEERKFSESIIASLPGLFFMVDENWGLSVARLRRGEGDVAYLLGGGLTLYPVWIATTGLGAVFGGLVVDPRAFAMDFLPLALFLSLLLLFWFVVDSANLRFLADGLDQLV